MSCQYRQNPDEYDKAWGRPQMNTTKRGEEKDPTLFLFCDRRIR
ncbi:hypothetical protein LTSEWAN_3303 [Salmonella enterica subsp. enterica serovar Wandsworth str. A4-580]|uniref:Uncharacterized protein n=1 Tax=Salmonella enterica subsp. enterica serovar Wandsworth str. A4-580 TaxID=913086 RepID=G5SDD5_SALET|nr:hypothetical protein LTSEWAN_3303 [Salmonella enterica subsp. enterica serovar Wandsworth str. A4-580]